MTPPRFLGIAFLLGCAWIGLLSALPLRAETAEGPDVGFAYDDFDLTLEPGHRTEIAGPFYYREQKQDTLKIWAIPPLLSYTTDPATEMVEFNIVYPVFSYIRYGKQYRWQLGQLLNFSGGPTQTETVRDRHTLFPFYFRQKSTDSNNVYTAVGPFYGHLQNRLFRDEISYVMFPIYGKTRKRDVVTRNYFYPVVHVREGEGLKGWQVWPICGGETKGITTRTNGFGDVEMIPGYHRSFAVWPFFAEQETGLGSANPQWQQLSLPLYNLFRSPMRDSTTVLWPFFTWIDDREKGYKEWQAPWPFITFARGEKTINRFWPIYSHAYNTNLQVDSVLWPIYRYSRIRATAVDRQRTRILFYLYSDTLEKDLAKNRVRHRVDFWPFFTSRKEYNGNTRLQVLAPLEPLLPANHNIDIEYSHAWSLWRSEKNPRTGNASQSLLWNLYRREVTPKSRKVSCFFGLYQSRTSEEGTHTRLFYIPIRRH